MSRKKLFYLLVSVILLIGCSADKDVAYQYETAEIIDDTICHLKETLLRNEYIIRVYPVTFLNYQRDRLNASIKHANFEQNEFIIYRIRYISDDYEVIGYVAAPSDFMKQNYPIVIYNRGGNRNFGRLTPNEIILAALQGSIVLGSQYRGNAGGTGMEQLGGDDINDVLRLIDISESFEFAQQGGVYMFGASRGGMMTYIASRLDDRIVAAAVWATNSNVFEAFHERELTMQRTYIDLVGGTPEELPEEFERRSAIFWANELQAPFLIGHGGEADWRVLTHQSVNMAAALERYNMPHRLILYPDADHGMPAEFAIEVFEWFMQHPIGE